MKTWTPRSPIRVDAGLSGTRIASVAASSTNVFLRTDLDFIRNKGLCSYSEDDKNRTALGGEFDLKFDRRTGTFQGEQLAIFYCIAAGNFGFGNS